jgi:hypothetical protein
VKYAAEFRQSGSISATADTISSGCCCLFSYFSTKMITAINLSRHSDIMRIWEASVLATHDFLKPAH